ncbi:hypothetical protein [Frondihabitans australicus]|uniref:Uncharacterized protein n=1 Tax=Frondihabitans australicus TaxID=386892 RepID=A0A495IDZ4_9MICO|nr:hypothetical protein [Frondihabitans australicus]RKR73999.1 hypothetical protein C8E83_1100 [Frondihabitans australicus]
MTDTLSTRPTTEAVKAYMEASDHPIRRSRADAESVETESVETGSADTGTADAHAAESGAFPEPPVRGSLDDDDLVPLVGRHTTDTATIDLIGILQAQMQLRAEEAARFAVWEEQMRLIGTDEALGELERTRLHFTGVIPVQTAPTIVTADAVPQSSRLVPERLVKSPEPVVTVTAVPDTGENPHVQRAREADERLLEIEDDTVPSAARLRNATRPAVSGGRIAIVALTTLAVVAVVVGVASALLLPVGALTLSLAAVGLLGAAWLVVLAVRVLLRRGQAG